MENFQNKYLEIKNINKDVVNWVEDIAEENNCRIERKEWKSKYNSYVVYDYDKINIELRKISEGKGKEKFFY